MNPRDRKLRLRKSTVSDLTPRDASHVQGGLEKKIDIISWLINCPDNPPYPTNLSECCASNACTYACSDPCSAPGAPASQCIAC